MDKIRIDSLRSIRTSRLADTDVDSAVIDISPWRETYPALTDYRVEATSPDGVVYFPAKVALKESELVWTITAEDTASAGDGLYQVVATGANGERKTSAYATFAVRETMPGAASDISPDPAKPWVDKVVKAAQKVEDATVHPPIIGENGNWMLWDFEASAYVDSGKPSYGGGSGGGSGGITQESDPTVPAWAKQPEPPTYTAEDVGARPAGWLPTLNEIGAQPAGNYALKSEIPAVPVQSVNGKTGAVELTAEDVGAASKESVDRLNEEKADKKDIPAPYTLPTASVDTLGGVKVGEGLQMDGDVLNASMGYRLLASYTFNELANGVTITEIDGQPMNLNGLVVIFDRIGDGESEQQTGNPQLQVLCANGNERTVKAGYHVMAGKLGNCWNVCAEIRGDYLDIDAAAATPSSNAQINNGNASVRTKQLSWRNLQEQLLPIQSIVGFHFTIQNSVTPGSRMWLYGKER